MKKQNLPMRINRLLSDSGLCSRREADRLIEEGRVTIDGRVAVLGDQVAEGAAVAVDGRAVSGGAPKVYLALHKPEGIVCTTDSREPMNVIDYLNYPERVFPIGRLDRDSSGLLLLTSDGAIVNRILRAAGGHEKEYRVSVTQPVTDEFLRRMATGVEILGRVTLPCKVWKTGDRSFGIVLVQGINRQIRRMCEALGYRVHTLERVRVMNITLSGLEPGHYRKLTDDEVAQMLRQTEGTGATEGTPGATEGTPGAAEGTPGATEGTPGAAEGTPGATEGTPGAAEGTPGLRPGPRKGHDAP